MIKVIFEPKENKAWEPEDLRFEDYTLVSYGGQKNYWYKTGSNRLKEALAKGAFIIERKRPEPAQVVNKPVINADNYFKSKTPWKK